MNTLAQVLLMMGIIGGQLYFYDKFLPVLFRFIKELWDLPKTTTYELNVAEFDKARKIMDAPSGQQNQKDIDTFLARYGYGLRSWKRFGLHAKNGKLIMKVVRK